MADDRLVRKVRDGTPEGKRNRGSTDEKMDRRTGINRPSAYKKKRREEKKKSNFNLGHAKCDS